MNGVVIFKLVQKILHVLNLDLCKDSLPKYSSYFFTLTLIDLLVWGVLWKKMICFIACLFVFIYVTILPIYKSKGLYKSD